MSGETSFELDSNLTRAIEIPALIADGSETLYTVSGAIRPQLYNALLSEMSVRPEP